jgi:hypothetical protein
MAIVPFPSADMHASVKQLVGTQIIKLSHKLTGMVIYDLASFFKVIEFFEDCYRNDDVVLFKVIDTGTVVQNNVGIEDEGLFSHKIAIL